MSDPEVTEFTGAELLAALAAMQAPQGEPETVAASPPETTAALPESPALPRYQLVHLGTSVTSTFAILEPGGNISARKPFVLESEFLTPEAMAAAVTALQQQARRHGNEYLAEAPESFAPLAD